MGLGPSEVKCTKSVLPCPGRSDDTFFVGVGEEKGFRYGVGAKYPHVVNLKDVQNTI